MSFLDVFLTHFMINIDSLFSFTNNPFVNIYES